MGGAGLSSPADADCCSTWVWGRIDTPISGTGPRTLMPINVESVPHVSPSLAESDDLCAGWTNSRQRGDRSRCAQWRKTSAGSAGNPARFPQRSLRVCRKLMTAGPQTPVDASARVCPEFRCAGLCKPAAVRDRQWLMPQRPETWLPNCGSVGGPREHDDVRTVRPQFRTNDAQRNVDERPPAGGKPDRHR